MPNILVTICARGGSKGIPGKNIKPVGGKPLIAYTIATAQKFAARVGADIVLSTDSQQIKDVAASFGLHCDYVRPDYLANDTCAKPEAIRDVMHYASKRFNRAYDMVVDLDVTSPIRTIDDIEACIDILNSDPDALTVFSVNPCERNPYFSQVDQKSNGYYSEVISAHFTTRQSCPKVYDMNGSIYVYRPEALEKERPKAVTDRSLIYVMDHICFDLDEPTDYDYLAFLVDTNRVKI